jgi:uncharacterized membrane protein
MFLGAVIFNQIVKGFGVNKINEYTTEQFLIIFNALLIFASILFVMFRSLGGVAHGVYTYLSEYGQVFTFSITKGDQKRQEEMHNRNKENARRIIVRTIFSLIFNVACGIIATVLVTKW